MKKIIFTISLTQLLLGIAVGIIAFLANSTVSDIRMFESETRKSLNETAKAIEGAHDVYSGSAQCTAEAVKNIQKTVPAIKRLGYTVNGLSHAPIIGKRLGKNPGTPIVEFAINIDDFANNLTSYYDSHNEQNKTAIKTAAQTLRNTSNKIQQRPFSKILSTVQILLLLLGLILITNGSVMLYYGINQQEDKV